MLFNFGFVSLKKLVVSSNGLGVLEVNETIAKGLNKQDYERYGNAVQKVVSKEKLGRADLAVLDKVDELTMQKHSICLKDSKVTKARIKGCKRFGIEFIDRDGLVEHMQQAFAMAQK